MFFNRHNRPSSPLQCVQRDRQLEAAAQVPLADRGQEGLGAGGLVRRLHPRPRPRPQRLTQARPQARQAPLRPQVGTTYRGRLYSVLQVWLR